MDKKLIRDRIEYLKFKRLSKSERKQKDLVIHIGGLAALISFFIFELQGERRLLWIISLAFIIIIVIYYLYWYKEPRLRETILIEKNYDLLLNKKKK